MFISTDNRRIDERWEGTRVAALSMAIVIEANIPISLSRLALSSLSLPPPYRKNSISRAGAAG